MSNGIRSRRHADNYAWALTNTRPLPRAQQLELLRNAQRGNIAARDRLVLTNMRLVVACAQGCNRPDLLEDLIQVGVVGDGKEREPGHNPDGTERAPNPKARRPDAGRRANGLMGAIASFDTECGIAFSSYAVRVIRDAMATLLAQQTGALTAGKGAQWRQALILRAYRRLKARGVEAGAADVFAELDGKCSLDLIEDTLQPAQQVPLEEVGDIAEHRADDNAALEERERILRWHLERLPVNEGKVLVMHYGLGGRECSTREIADALSLSASGVLKLRASGERRLRKLLARKCA